MIKFGWENEICMNRAPFVQSICDTEDNVLRIQVVLSHTGEKGTGQKTGNPKLDDIIKKCTPIYPDNDYIYEITFERYIIYQTRNESFCSMAPYEIKKGRYFSIYTRSRLLDLLQNITDCSRLSDGSYYPDKWTHYGICSQNHIIDIISACKPAIIKISSCSCSSRCVP